MDKYNYHMHIL